MSETRALLKEVGRLFREEGYRVGYCEAESSCFDLVAKKDQKLVLVKVVANVDCFTRKQATDLKKLAYALRAIPLLVGLRSHRGELLEGVLYERYGINTVSLRTLQRALCRGEMPLALAKRGGLYVRISSEELREARARRNLSLGELASMLGVSRRTIYEYERSRMLATLEIALKLEEVLDEDLVEPFDIFSWEAEEVDNNHQDEQDEPASRARRALIGIGLRAVTVRRAPFNLAAGSEEIDLKVIAEARRKVEEIGESRVRALKRVATAIDARTLIMVERHERVEDIDGVPVISIQEIELEHSLEKLVDRLE